MVDTPAFEKLDADSTETKLLVKGLLKVADLVIIVLDALDCDLRKSKLGKLIKKSTKA